MALMILPKRCPFLIVPWLAGMMVSAAVAKADVGAPAGEQPGLVAPVAIGPTQVAPPQDAPRLSGPVRVQARIFLDVTGMVTRVELVGDHLGPWGEAVLLGAAGFTFKPAMEHGQPVASGLVFTQEFLPPPTPAPQTAVLDGTLVEKGSRKPVPLALVRAQVGGTESVGQTDASGHFHLMLPAGPARVRVDATGYKLFTVSENLQAHEQVEVRYLIERSAYNAYETLVLGKHDRTEVARTTLQGAELTEVPGTFGDPFRVVTTLPGVGSIFSLLGFAIVRGTGPNNTAYMLDGVVVPELFHLLAGPSVLHPEFVERVDFYPGTFGANYGGYIGGIVDGITRRAPPQDKRVDIGVDLTQAGLFLRGPLPFGFTGTLAGRYGYPGLLLAAFRAPVGLSYWDYQGRLDGPLGGGHLKIFVFGAFDELTNTGPQGASVGFGTQFHRLDITYDIDGDRFIQKYGVAFGYDETLAGGTESDLREWLVLPRTRWSLKPWQMLTFNAGIDAGLRHYQGTTHLTDVPAQDSLNNWGGFLEAQLMLDDRWVITPGVRADDFSDGAVNKWGIDPRLGVRWRLGQWLDGDAWLKLGAGHYHQPPRSVLPLPGLDVQGLSEGLLSSWQLSLGTELVPLPATELDVQVYYSYMDSIIFDLAVNQNPLAVLTPSQTASVPTLLGGLLGVDQGRSYGLEVLLRKRDTGTFFGWLSYTLSRSQRLIDGVWSPFDFDRTHMVQAVGSWRLPRNWEVGGRLQFETGRPVSTATGYNVGRSPAFYRIDVRIDKRAVWADWLLDFYVDIINLTVAPEYVDQTSQTFHYILPTVGLRAVL